MKVLKEIDRLVSGCLVACFCLTALGVHAQVWTEAPLHRLTAQEYEMTLDFWAKKYADRLTVESIGKSSEGLDIPMLKITDKSVKDEDKQVALITSLHGGPERSGTTAVLTLTEWLLSDDKEAIETRRKQVVLVIPIIHPHSYFVTDRFLSAGGIDPYTGGGAGNWDFETLTYKKSDACPELMAFLGVVDKYRPDVNLDLHGTGLQEYSEAHKDAVDHKSYRGQTMFEVTGTAYSNSVLRPWDWRIIEAMVKAGVEEGFPSDRAEADAQMMHWIPGLGKATGSAWSGRPQFYSAQYAYLKYHTLVGCLEVSWEASGVARAKGMLRIGNNVWDGEKYAGYPVNRVFPFIGKYVTAWGETAEALRESRIDLWQKKDGFTAGILYPETEGRESFVVGLTAKGSAMVDENLETFVSNLRKDPTINANAIETHIKKGPEVKLAVRKSAQPATTENEIKRGLGLRLRIQYADAEVSNVRLNGHRLKHSRTDGYELWPGNGYLQLQINIPPEKAAKLDLAVVTCEYKPKVKRTYGWKPPQEVLDKIAGER